MSSRQSFKSLNNSQRDDYDDNEYAQRSQTAYQASVFDEVNENNYIDEINDAHWLSEYHDTDDNANTNYDDQFDLLDDYNQNVETTQDVNFLALVAKTSNITHSCNHCSDTFTSRNQLFKHLRNACWFDIEHVDYAMSIVKLSSSSIVSISQRNSNVETYELSHVSSSVNRRVIQSVVRFDETNSDYAFREYQYEQTIVKLDNSNENIKMHRYWLFCYYDWSQVSHTIII